MKSLWFKAVYVPLILSGVKQDTIRKQSNRLPKVGEQIGLSVGPIPPFAKAEVLSVERVATIHDKRREELVEIYGDDADMVKVTFRLLAQT